MIPITLNLNAKLQPIHRGERYEDPIDAFVDGEGIGNVDGGGTLLSATREVANCDVEIDLEPGDEALSKLLAFLEELGVPKGSRLLFGDDRADLPVGRLEGLGLYLNGTDLPDEVYGECDINVVVEELGKLLGDAGELYSWWQGPTETALYFYGDSFETMHGRIRPFVDAYPLCRKSRVVPIA